MTAQPKRTSTGNARRLVSWNTERFHCRILELDHILEQHDVDLCLQSEIFVVQDKFISLKTMSAKVQTEKFIQPEQLYWSAVV
jgi:hypothetical protein